MMVRGRVVILPAPNEDNPMNPESPHKLAADYKFHGMDKFRAWDQYVIDMGLRPEINAGDFYAIFESVTASPRQIFNRRPTGFIATHHDTMFDIDCQITVDSLGVWSIVWENGHTGSHPPCCPPDRDRYIPIEAQND
jgi:hypothetical protein